MPSPADLAGLNKTKLHLGDFAARFAPEATPFSSAFSYYAAAVPLPVEDLRDFIDEPISAIPPRIAANLGKIVVILVPFLESPIPRPPSPRNGKRAAAKPAPSFNPSDTLVAMDPPAPENRLPVAILHPAKTGEPQVLAFAVQDIDSSQYHHNFFQAISTLVFLAQPDPIAAGYRALLREELKLHAHGEVDDASWKAKLALLEKETGLRRESKLFLEYARHSFLDTLTLYLHGICCDIDVEPGPRQIASRYLRKRLQYFQSHYAPPEGYAVFPEELKN
jgi:hypothetical protein